MLLEELVELDMILNGYDPKVKKDVDKYWQERL
jgi:hypothetical protein